jgi:hypothetical protein
MNDHTPKELIVLCSHCGNPANPTTRWESGWPLYGRIELGFPSRIFSPLVQRVFPDCNTMEKLVEGHKAAVNFEAQEVVFEWGNGYKFDSSDRYRLCYKCQRELIEIIGSFFWSDVDMLRSERKENETWR